MLALDDNTLSLTRRAMLAGIYNGIALQAVPARGRGCVAQRDIKAGETLLIDWPIILVCSTSEQHCYNCLRDLSTLGMAISKWLTGPSSNLQLLTGTRQIKVVFAGQSGVQCSDCRIAVFCSDACLHAAKGNPAAHAADVCRSYALNSLRCSVNAHTATHGDTSGTCISFCSSHLAMNLSSPDMQGAQQSGPFWA